MANLSDLVHVLARVTGLPEATAFAYGRFAREAGLISQEGRGKAAAKMTWADAANLLIAVGGTGVTRDAGEAIKSFRALPGGALFVGHPLDSLFQDWLSPLGLSNEPDASNLCPLDVDFGGFLEFLIRETAQGRLLALLTSIPLVAMSPELVEAYWSNDQQVLQRAAVKPIDDYRIGSYADLWLELIFDRVAPAVFVNVHRMQVEDDQICSIAFRHAGQPSQERDLSVHVTVTQSTIGALGACIDGVAIPESIATPHEFSEYLFSPGQTRSAGVRRRPHASTPEERERLFQQAQE